MTRTFNFDAQDLYVGDNNYTQSQVMDEMVRILGSESANALTSNVTLGSDFIEYDRIVAHNTEFEDDARDVFRVIEKTLPDGVRMAKGFVLVRVRVSIPEDSFLLGAVTND